jgi:serine/threonine-protein kinase
LSQTESDPAALYAAFQQLAVLPPAQWPDRAAKAFPADPQARSELLDLLHSQGGADAGIDIGALLADALDALERTPGPAAGARIGDWQVLERIGAGGMGGVYRVRRCGVDYVQEGALKLGTSTDRADDQRIEAECRILAGLTHANIARLLDGGVAAGRRWFVMELVDGQPIDRAASGLDISARVELLVQVGEALAHAHRRLVVHRDLKPSNVLVEQVDGTARVRLLDFGIARSLDGSPGLTRAGGVALTVRYSAPEQLRGEPPTTAVDIHGLGLLAYEVLTGRHPFADRVDGDLVRALLEDLPAPPSSVARIAVRDRSPGSSADARRQSAAALPARDGNSRAHQACALRGDLDAIVLRALRKEPGERYPTIQALTDDLRAWQAGKAVAARSGQAGYRVRRIIRRHWLAIGAATTAVLALVVLSAVALDQALRSKRALHESEQVVGFFSGLLHDLHPSYGRQADSDQMRVVDLFLQASDRLDQADLPLRSRARLTADLGNGLNRLGRSDRAIDLARQLRQLPGITVQDRAEALLLEAYALPPSANQDARALMAQARALIGNGVDPDGAMAARILIDSAGLLKPIGRSREGETMLRDAIELLERTELAQRRHADLAVAHDSLASIQADAGDIDAALVSIDQALAYAALAFGPGHGLRGIRLASKAQILERAGRSGEAGELHRQALALASAALGDQHEDVVTLRNNYAIWLQRNGDLDGAIAEHRRVLAQRRQAGGPDELDSGHSLQNLAAVLLRAGRPGEARASALQALAIYDRDLPLGSHLAAFPRLSLAEAELELGDLAAAQDWASQALERLTATLGAESMPARVAAARVQLAARLRAGCRGSDAAMVQAVADLRGTGNDAASHADAIAQALARACP